MSWLFISYIFICIVLGLGTFVTINNSGRLWAALLCLILFILIFVFFGLRWFRGTTSAFEYQGNWPPMINMCPDYLVYYKRNNSTDTCVDLIGINKDGVAFKAWDNTDSAANPPSDSKKYFNYIYKPGMTKSQLQVLCNAAMGNGLTWEGICNGESCTFDSSAIATAVAASASTTCAPAQAPSR
jgi:hypothetical protein